MASQKIAAVTNHNHDSSTPNSAETNFADEVLKLAQCLMPVAPTAKVKHVAINAKQDAPLMKQDAPLNEVAWKTYDSVVGLAKQTTDGMFSNATVGQLLGGTIDLILRWQRFNTAIAGAFFGAFWPAIGLPTAPEVAAMRADIRGLREMLRAGVLEESNEYARELHRAAHLSLVDGTDGHHARKPGTRQVAIFTGWTGAEHRGATSDVGN